ncbi:MAG: hypothetical protein IKG15_07030 [Solobacterium sp.]|nr:hypothetical protein [Solobacterium sp.]
MYYYDLVKNLSLKLSDRKMNIRKANESIEALLKEKEIMLRKAGRTDDVVFQQNRENDIERNRCTIFTESQNIIETVKDMRIILDLIEEDVKRNMNG